MTERRSPKVKKHGSPKADFFIVIKAKSIRHKAKSNYLIDQEKSNKYST
jgi:hypothetical protein